jgi:hypothetical protein
MGFLCGRLDFRGRADDNQKIFIAVSRGGGNGEGEAIERMDPAQQNNGRGVTIMTAKEKYELIERISAWSLFEQLEFIEALVRQLRKANTDREAIEKQMDALVADEGMQRVLRNEDLENGDATW